MEVRHRFPLCVQTIVLSRFLYVRLTQAHSYSCDYLHNKLVYSYFFILYYASHHVALRPRNSLPSVFPPRMSLVVRLEHHPRNLFETLLE